jgi:pectinesterase
MDDSHIINVSGNEKNNSIQKAIESIPVDLDRTVIFKIKNGIYREKIIIDRNNISLIGEDPDKTIITFDDGALKKNAEGIPMGTFNSYTAYFGGDDIKVENITFINSAGKGNIAGQAIAIYADGNRMIFKNCKFVGNQDTLFTGPLPPESLIKNGFFGPGQNKPRNFNYQYYENCFIKGDIDFIFGSAFAVFNKCEIYSVNNGKTGFITAPSTPQDQEYGYVFIDCNLTGDAAPGSVYLGRPWRKFAKAVFVNCYLGDHINKAGWHNWEKCEAEKTVFFAEYGSKGPGAKACDRVKWAKILSSSEAQKYIIPKINEI